MRFQLHMSVYKNMIVCHTFMESTLRFEKYQTNDGHWKGSVLKKSEKQWNSLGPIRDDLTFRIRETLK